MYKSVSTVRSTFNMYNGWKILKMVEVSLLNVSWMIESELEFVTLTSKQLYPK